MWKGTLKGVNPEGRSSSASTAPRSSAAATPAPTWEPARANEVHFSWMASTGALATPPYVTGVFRPAALTNVLVLNRTTVLALAFVVMWASIVILRRAVLLPVPAVVALYVGLGGFAIWHLSSMVRTAWGINKNPPGLPLGPDSAWRVRCCGTAPRLKRLGPIRDAAFEPELFDASFAQAGSPEGFLGRPACTLAGLAIVITGAYLVFGGFRPIYSNSFLGIWSVFALALMIGGLLSALIWPVYYRLEPGRFELIHAGFLGRGPDRVERIDLSTGGVIVDLNRQRVFIDPPGRPRLVLETTLLGRGYEFERCVLMAAVSSAGAPQGGDPIPTDADPHRS